jgi:hypothetical protein
MGGGGRYERKGENYNWSTSDQPRRRRGRERGRMHVVVGRIPPDSIKQVASNVFETQTLSTQRLNVRWGRDSSHLQTIGRIPIKKPSLCIFVLFPGLLQGGSDIG